MTKKYKKDEVTWFSDHNDPRGNPGTMDGVMAGNSTHGEAGTVMNAINTNEVSGGGDEPVGSSAACPESGSNAVPAKSSPPARALMAGKPVIYRDAKTALTLDADEFHEKWLCDGITLNLGDACVFSCEFCYVEAQMRKLDSRLVADYNTAEGLTGEKALGFRDLVIRRRNAVELVKGQLTKSDGTPRFADPTDNRVVFCATVVDLAANMELLRETAAAFNLILDNTHWQIRLLSKSNLLHLLVKDGLIPEKHHRRLIFGFSTGTLDDRVAKAIETGTPLVSMRLESLHWLQDHGFRTFGMICPSLPQTDYAKFSRGICAAIRVDRCEHVWAEVINTRGESKSRTLEALRTAGLNDEAAMLEKVSTDGDKWEKYARATFEAHAKNVPGEKLRFLQYVTKESAPWWGERIKNGAVLLGKHAGKFRRPLDAPIVPASSALTAADIEFRDEKEKLVSAGVSASIAAAKALHEIFTYKGGLIWRQKHKSFESYCREKWDYKKAHSYRLKDAGDFVFELERQSPKGDHVPKNENQIRPLLALPKENRVDCWKEIVAGKSVEKLTGAAVAEGTRKFADSHKLDLDGNRKAPGSDKNQATAALERLRSAVEPLPQAEKIESLLAEVEELIG
jgi:DNA repair photolyase